MARKATTYDEPTQQERAREARRQGMTPSEAGVTTGAHKQRRHQPRSEEHDEKLESLRHGKRASGGSEVPGPLRGKGRSRDPRTGTASDKP